MMNILLLGSGGREHTLAWKIKQSKKFGALYIAPGNAGTELCGKNIPINPNDFVAIKEFVLENNINMIVVGPEEPLVKGIADFFSEDPDCKNMAVIGPNKMAARLEGSKEFAKQFMQKYKIPTASYKSFTRHNYNEAVEFLKTLNPPYVIKADGLAAGKGVVICSSIEQAENELDQMLNNQKFGAASERVVIEEFLSGVEMSVFVATDGVNYKLLPHAKDYKKIGEQDTGLNTGGMGAVSPVPFVDNGLMDRIVKSIIEPTINGLKTENIDYRGFIFFGLIIVDGLPYVIEYNVRMGDPETEVVIPLIKSDIIELFEAIAEQKINTYNIDISEGFASTVMLVSGGYPEAFEKNKTIVLKEETQGNCVVFHAGTQKDNEGLLKTNGGRVIAVTAFGETLQQALSTSYANIKNIFFDGMYYRKDIGKDMLKIIDKQNIRN